MAKSSMDNFCGSAFWNRTLSWDTEDPDLTKCFEKTVLVWVPCAFLWLFSSLEVFYIINSKKRNIPWNWLNLSKLFFTFALIIVCATDLATTLTALVNDKEEVFNVDIYTPIIKILTFGLSSLLLMYNRKYGLRTSGLQFLFWLFFGLCGAPQFRTELRDAETETPEPYYFFISYLVFYPLIVIMFLLNCLADQAPKDMYYPKSERPCPEEGSGFLSRLFFAWFDGLAIKGFRNPLEVGDLWDMKHEDSAREVVPLFDKYWQQSVRKCEGISTTSSTTASFKTDSARVDFTNNPKKKHASILPALIKAFGPTFAFGAFLKLFQDVLTFVSPQILRLIISFADNHDSPWKGYFYAVILFVQAIIQTLVLSQYFNRMFIVGMRIRTALVSAIYRKALRMSNTARKQSTVGEIVNLMSVDAQKFIELTAYLNMIWSAPLQIILALYFLWGVLGPSVLAGLAVMIILIPVNGFIANKVKDLQIRQMKNKDERVKLMNEILSGIKVLKLYAWEPSFEAQVLKIRTKELRVLKEAAYLNAGTSFIWSCAPFLVSLCTFMVFVYSDDENVLTPTIAFVSLSLFSILHIPMAMLPLLIVFAIEVSLVSFATFVLVDEKNVLDASTAFVSLSLFNILRFPLSMLPMMISNMVQAGVSVQRINKFMNCEELDTDSVSHDSSENAPLLIENGHFTWGEDPVLRNINVRFSAGSLTAVVGTVGSGKSSLVSAFLGEMVKTQGRVNTNGSIAYVSQQAWIQNATLRDNILFGKPLDKPLYDRIVDACALRPDFDMLPAGDQTEIGEKGINLSGGQKQRISLARAVYADADIYFLDDPLSAVDSHVGRHMFEQVLGPQGLLAKKTRVLVTHGITYLPHTDRVLVLVGGEVSEAGTYQELLDRKGAFAEFLIAHISAGTEAGAVDDEELDEIANQLIGTPISDEITRKLQRHRSRVSESISETGSDRATGGTGAANGSLQRQKSTDSSNSVLRQRSSSTEAAGEIKKAPTGPLVGEKLIDVEKTETGSVKWEVYKHYLRSIGVGLAVITLALNMIFQGFSIGTNMWLSVWSEDKEANETGKRDMYLGVYGALGIGQVLAVFLSALALFVGTLNGAKIMHNLLVGNILRSPMHFYDVTPVGRILNRFSKDVDTLDTVLPMTIRGWITCCFAVLGTLFVISFTTPIFVVVIIPIGFVYYFIQRFYVATSRQLKRLESVSRSPIYSHFGETVTGAQAIRAFGEQDRFIRESEARVDFNQISYYPSIIANRWLAVRLEMVGNLIILFAAIFVVIGGDQNPGFVGLSISYALQITQTLNWLVRMTSDVETNIVAVERIKEYGETPQEAAWDVPSTQPASSWPDVGRVEFRGVAVRYRAGLDLVLRGVDFTVRGGEKVGIVGRTGAGKSSLTLALFRIIEAAAGEIIIDGVKISQLGLHALRSRLTIIPQDAVLFSGTLRMNLDPFDTHSDNDVWTSLEHAHLKSFVKGLPAGLNHEVSEGGENLSVGQRQLICLARALLRKTKILVLDEATAAVDLETDDLIQRTIRAEFRDCTVLTIAHRLNTIMDSDRVIVLDRGAIVEFDSPQRLLGERSSVFHGMCKDAGLA